MIKQNGLTLILPIKSDADAEWLRSKLAAMGKHLGKTPTVDFRKSRLTHFARFVVIPGASGQPGSERLLFSSNFDGDLKGYAYDLIQTGLALAMEEFFSRCEGYTKGIANNPLLFFRFLEGRNISIQAFFVALRSVTVNLILESAAIRRELETSLDAGEMSFNENHDLPLKPQQVINRAADPSLAPKKPGFSLATVIANLLISTVEWIIGLRKKQNNPQVNLKTDARLYAAEDIVTQNQMTVVVPVKRTITAYVMLRLVLFVMNQVFKLSKGKLSDLDSIHFARWVIIDGGRNILFESNFDGSWENYIDDFADHAVAGMNLVWGNCIGFPISGSSDVESFKRYIRDHQTPAQVYYSAYPDSTVRNIFTDISLNTKVTKFARPYGRRNFIKGYYGSPGLSN
ncbi:hypothetical protein [Pedobacter hartonius]|uniref:Uncharacterized protein n=1 Tax=Pedobacter hartonius TaxID=425514 RepID=A0A1H4GLP2_9SPHI|nr:hypothetical protein [Pedobacter hartonius]SEB10417.1 hypothetical protein SAMN05443550_110173 [Pedobacter hartonius]